MSGKPASRRFANLYDSCVLHAGVTPVRDSSYVLCDKVLPREATDDDIENRSCLDPEWRGGRRRVGAESVVRVPPGQQPAGVAEPGARRRAGQVQDQAGAI